MKAFQYKILNSILYTKKKLFKIGYSYMTNEPSVTMNQKH